MQEKNQIPPFLLSSQSQNSVKIKDYQQEYYQRHLEEQRKQKLEYYQKNSVDPQVHILE